MSLWYKLLYQLGFTPWEEDPEHGAASEQISLLLQREENDHTGGRRRALDLGCGAGIWSVHLAERGWEVTGIDIVPKAINRARERARAAGVEVNFTPGDVAALRAAGLQPGFHFVLDFECFNHLGEAQRILVGREVTALAAPDATMLMLVWSPGRRPLLPPGADRSDLERAFPEWIITHEEGYAAPSALPWWLKNVELRFYRLRRLMHSKTEAGPASW